MWYGVLYGVLAVVVLIALALVIRQFRRWG